MIKIDKGVEIPAGGNPPKYPFNELEEIGDSFFIEGRESTQISSSMQAAKHRYSDRKFISRTVDGGVRVWRAERNSLNGT